MVYLGKNCKLGGEKQDNVFCLKRSLYFVWKEFDEFGVKYKKYIKKQLKPAT